ncbi:MAG: hypothetical protein QOE59_3115 [Actinomycetota bacterium]|jgi:hypothetical protein|nr:hypothetical protein [Actinomycetota bacterium]
MRVMLDIVRSGDGRLEGTVATETGPEHPFSGTLELLRVLEDLQPGAPLTSGTLPRGPR